MRSSSMFIAVCVLAIVSIAAPAATLDPIWRGQPDTTYQAWGFETDANPASAFPVANPYGSPSAAITVNEPSGTGWQNQLFGMGDETGYWDLGSAGTIVCDLPNAAAIQAATEVWVQVTYFRDINQAPAVNVPGAQFVSSHSQTIEIVETGGAWLVDQSIWRFEPGVSSEQVSFSASAAWGSVISMIVIDTINVPEPASLLLLALGSLAVRRRMMV